MTAHPSRSRVWFRRSRTWHQGHCGASHAAFGHITSKNGARMSQRDRRPVKLLIFGAARRRESLNARLAKLAGEVAARNGATVDHASLVEFECPFYDGDVEKEQGIPKGANDF